MKQILLKVFNANGDKPAKAGQKLLLLSFASILLTMTSIAQNCPTSGLTNLNKNMNTFFPANQATVAAGTKNIAVGAATSGGGFTATPIAVGDIVFIIQVQGAQITVPVDNTSYGYGDGTGNASGFITTNLQAGHMEFGVAANAVTIAGGTLTLATGLTYSYYNSAATATSGQYSYQVLRVPTYYDVKITGSFSTPFWNGSTGGITIINAVNSIDLNSKKIDAIGAGFRGGGGKKGAGNATATKLDLYVTSALGPDGSKGEGIAGTPKYVNNSDVSLLVNAAEGYPGGSYAAGAPANAGGGATDSRPTANDQNAGGGGGGNGGEGGLGGNGWYSFGYTGGFGGSGFVAGATGVNYATPSRLIFGGGGGAGDTNDGTGTPGAGFASSGAAGGGLIILSATTITNTGTIDVSGAFANNTVLNDASGGGGAGGSILIYAASGNSGVKAVANGGNGGSNNPLSVGATQHGPGGGGGGGVIFSNHALSASSTANPGNAGISSGTNAINSFNAGNGLPGSITQSFPFNALPPNTQSCQIIILPVTIMSFSASYASAGIVKIDWKTTNEINASYFVIERSEDGANFTPVGQVSASQSGSNAINDYNYNDNIAAVNGTIVYYRLRVVDADGKYSYSKIVPIKLDQPKTAISIYPNPVENYATLSLYADNATTAVYRVFDNAGKQITTKSVSVSAGTNSINIDQLSALSKGIYVVQVILNNNLYTQKLIKK